MTDKDRLDVNIKNGCLIISVGVKTLAFAAENNQFFCSADGEQQIHINDPNLFAKDVLRALKTEQEDGSTPVTRLIDAACEITIEQGSEGLKL